MADKETTPTKGPGHTYDATSIKVLGGIEAVRKRPAMYIGSTGELGLHHLVWEVVDNSVDEALAGYCDEINVTVHEDNSVTVLDNGRGIPVDMHATEKKPAAEVVMTVLHAGGKFDTDTYKVSGGLHGVGVSVVNALSDWLDLEIMRDGQVWEQAYEKGVPTSKLKVTGKTRKTGTKVTFHPDPSIFTEMVFSFDTLSQRLRELAFLNKGLKITLDDERNNKKAEFRFTGGIAEFVKHLNRGKQTLHDSPIYFEGKRDTTDVEIALQYNDSYAENVFAFANTINTVDGGTHISGFRSALTRTINYYASSFGMLKDQKDQVSITGDDVREGLVAVVSVKLPSRNSRARPKANSIAISRARSSNSSTSGLANTSTSTPRSRGKSSASALMPHARVKPPVRLASSLAENPRSIRAAYPASSPIARSAIRPAAKSSSSKANRPAARPRAGATAAIRRSCPSRARFSTLKKRGTTRCWATKKFAPSSPRSVLASAKMISMPPSSATTK